MCAAATKGFSEVEAENNKKKRLTVHESGLSFIRRKQETKAKNIFNTGKNLVTLDD